MTWQPKLSTQQLDAIQEAAKELESFLSLWGISSKAVNRDRARQMSIINPQRVFSLIIDWTGPQTPIANKGYWLSPGFEETSDDFFLSSNNFEGTITHPCTEFTFECQSCGGAGECENCESSGSIVLELVWDEHSNVSIDPEPIADSSLDTRPSTEENDELVDSLVEAKFVDLIGNPNALEALKRAIKAEARGDLVSATAAYSSAADKGSLDAMARLGDLAEESGNLDQAKRWWTLAARGGNSDGLLGLGILAHVEGDFEEAESWWKQSAEAGNVKAMYNVGSLYLGNGNVPLAQNWLQQAAAGGFVEAMISLANIARESGNDQMKYFWYQQAAESGHVSAMYNVGVLARGEGDLDKAEIWWKKAAENGHLNAKLNLGTIFEDRGDPSQAAFWYKEAAAEDSLDAMFNLGVMAFNAGERESAKSWFVTAASKGHQLSADILNKNF
jgi:TPR repeat protein